MSVFLDLDGVMVDLVGGLIRKLECSNPYHLEENKGIFSLKETMGFDAWHTLDRDFWANLLPTPEWMQILETIESKFGRENICLLSSPTNAECIIGKMQWIDRFLGEYRKRYFFGNPKHMIGGAGKLLIDDSDENVEQWKGSSILIPRPWNKNHKLNTLNHFHETIDCFHD
jgi:5'(3')-deoxyribonucleotidase